MPVTFGSIGDHSTLATLLEHCDLGERYGEKQYKAEDLEAERVQLPPKGEAGLVPVEDVLFQQEAWLEDPSLLVKDEPVKASARALGLMVPTGTQFAKMALLRALWNT